MRPRSDNITRHEAGEARWFEPGELDTMKEKIVPSDIEMIREMILNSEGVYFESVMEWQGKNLVLKRFEQRAGQY
jgi:hypothetical protein